MPHLLRMEQIHARYSSLDFFITIFLLVYWYPMVEANHIEAFYNPALYNPPPYQAVSCPPVRFLSHLIPHRMKTAAGLVYQVGSGPLPVLGHRTASLIPCLGHRTASLIPCLGHRTASLIPCLGHSTVSAQSFVSAHRTCSVRYPCPDPRTDPAQIPGSGHRIGGGP